jgi:hypothetical protein
MRIILMGLKSLAPLPIRVSFPYAEPISFPFFDALTQRKMWWVSRYRENTSYSIAHVFYWHQEKLDGLIWLGSGKKQAHHLVRLVRLGDGIGIRMYLTNVSDPQMLSLAEIVLFCFSSWLCACAVLDPYPRDAIASMSFV